MRILLTAAALVALSAGAASAEPVKLDEAALGDVAGGLSIGFGPIDIGVANVITTPVLVDASVTNDLTNNINNNFDLDLDTQVGAALAVNTNAVIAAFSENIAGMGNSISDLGFATGAAGVAP